MTKTKDTVNEAAWNLSQSVRDASQAIAESTVAAQERNVKFAQGSFENGSELLKSHAESTRALTEEFMQHPQQERGIFQSIADSAVAAQERNMRFAQSNFENGVELLKSHAESTRALIHTLVEQVQKQQAAVQVLTQETWNASVDFLYAPFSYYEQTLDTAESIARQGMETAQRVTRREKTAAQSSTK
jgi:hypothetical protein